MSSTHPDRTTGSAPPKKPRGARRWPWFLALIGLLYVPGYITMRLTGRLVPTPSGAAPPYEIVDRDGLYMMTIDPEQHAVVWMPTPRSPAFWFRPCIAVEEWWRNR